MFGYPPPPDDEESDIDGLKDYNNPSFSNTFESLTKSLLEKINWIKKDLNKHIKKPPIDIDSRLIDFLSKSLINSVGYQFRVTKQKNTLFIHFDAIMAVISITFSDPVLKDLSLRVPKIRIKGMEEDSEILNSVLLALIEYIDGIDASFTLSNIESTMHREEYLSLEEILPVEYKGDHFNRFFGPDPEQFQIYLKLYLKYLWYARCVVPNLELELNIEQLEKLLPSVNLTEFESSAQTGLDDSSWWRVIKVKYKNKLSDDKTNTNDGEILIAIPWVNNVQPFRIPSVFYNGNISLDELNNILNSMLNSMYNFFASIGFSSSKDPDTILPLPIFLQ